MCLGGARAGRLRPGALPRLDRRLRRLGRQQLPVGEPGAEPLAPRGRLLLGSPDRQREGLPDDAHLLHSGADRPEHRHPDRLLDGARGGAPGGPGAPRLPLRHGARRGRSGQRAATGRLHLGRRRNRLAGRPLPPVRRRRGRHRLRLGRRPRAPQAARRGARGRGPRPRGHPRHRGQQRRLAPRGLHRSRRPGTDGGDRRGAGGGRCRRRLDLLRRGARHGDPLGRPDRGRGAVPGLLADDEPEALLRPGLGQGQRRAPRRRGGHRGSPEDRPRSGARRAPAEPPLRAAEPPDRPRREPLLRQRPPASVDLRVGAAARRRELVRHRRHQRPRRPRGGAAGAASGAGAAALAPAAALGAHARGARARHRRPRRPPRDAPGGGPRRRRLHPPGGSPPVRAPGRPALPGRGGDRRRRPPPARGGRGGAPPGPPRERHLAPGRLPPAGPGEPAPRDGRGALPHGAGLPPRGRPGGRDPRAAAGPGRGAGPAPVPLPGRLDAARGGGGAPARDGARPAGALHRLLGRCEAVAELGRRARPPPRAQPRRVGGCVPRRRLLAARRPGAGRGARPADAGAAGRSDARGAAVRGGGGAAAGSGPGPRPGPGARARGGQRPAPHGPDRRGGRDRGVPRRARRPRPRGAASPHLPRLPLALDGRGRRAVPPRGRAAAAAPAGAAVRVERDGRADPARGSGRPRLLGRAAAAAGALRRRSRAGTGRPRPVARRGRPRAGAGDPRAPPSGLRGGPAGARHDAGGRRGPGAGRLAPGRPREPGAALAPRRRGGLGGGLGRRPPADGAAHLPLRAQPLLGRPSAAGGRRREGPGLRRLGGDRLRDARGRRRVAPRARVAAAPRHALRRAAGRDRRESRRCLAAGPGDRADRRRGRLLRARWALAAGDPPRSGRAALVRCRGRPEGPLRGADGREDGARRRGAPRGAAGRGRRRGRRAAAAGPGSGRRRRAVPADRGAGGVLARPRRGLRARPGRHPQLLRGRGGGIRARAPGPGARPPDRASRGAAHGLPGRRAAAHPRDRAVLRDRPPRPLGRGGRGGRGGALRGPRGDVAPGAAGRPLAALRDPRNAAAGGPAAAPRELRLPDRRRLERDTPQARARPSLPPSRSRAAPARAELPRLRAGGARAPGDAALRAGGRLLARTPPDPAAGAGAAARPRSGLARTGPLRALPQPPRGRRLEPRQRARPAPRRHAFGPPPDRLLRGPGGVGEKPAVPPEPDPLQPSPVAPAGRPDGGRLHLAHPARGRGGGRPGLRGGRGRGAAAALGGPGPPLGERCPRPARPRADAPRGRARGGAGRVHQHPRPGRRGRTGPRARGGRGGRSGRGGDVARERLQHQPDAAGVARPPGRGGRGFPALHLGRGRGSSSRRG